MALFNDLNQGTDTLLGGRFFFYEDVMKNYDRDAPMKQWSDGFYQGHLWLLRCWKERASKQEWEDLIYVFMILAFFSKRALGEDLAKALGDDSPGLETLADNMRGKFYDALEVYRQLGRTLFRRGLRQESGAPAKKRRAGRNDPCPCGSGKKFKKCCIGHSSTVS